jgi:exonuclease III
MTNLSILIWNVRGLNDPHRKAALRSMVNYVKPFVVYVQETKLNIVTHWDVATCLGSDFGDYVFLPSHNIRGILIAWRPGLMSSIDSKILDNFVSICYFQLETNSSWWFTGVYGPTSLSQRTIVC